MGWEESYTRLRSEREPTPDDLGRLAEAAYMLGREDERLQALERAYQAHLDAGAARPAARCAFWSGLTLLLRGEAARANGWFGRAERLLERERDDCVEQGYLLVPALLAQVGRDDEAACATAAQAATIGERFGDRDLVALVVQEQGHALVRLGRVEQGLRLIDETMVAVVAGELSPIVTGLIYCNTIAFCQGALELGRARSGPTRWPSGASASPTWSPTPASAWSTAPRSWNSRATGTSPSKRPGAPTSLRLRFHQRRPRGLSSGRGPPRARGSRRRRAGVPRGEPLRVRAAARHRPPATRARARGRRGRGDPAGALRGHGSVRRLRLLPACVQIMLAAGDGEAARAASEELERLAARYDSGMARALAAHAAGAVALAEGDAGAALTALRRACREWQELGVPYEAARARVLVALACKRLGDEDAAALELEAAGDTSPASARPTTPSLFTPTRRTASRRASSRCCGWSRPGRPTGRSPPRS